MKYKKLLSGSFWLIVAIHLAVFTSIGLFTPKGWQLLIVFILAVAILFLLRWLLLLYAKRYESKHKFANFLSKMLLK